MTKYYYEGKLIRTSKKDNYTHAILWRNRVVACCGGYERAIKRYNQEFNYLSDTSIYSCYGNHSLEKARELKLVELNKIN